MNKITIKKLIKLLKDIEPKNLIDESLLEEIKEILNKELSK